jgi:hypothetical protein
LKLWTIQPISVWEILNQDGVYSPDHSKIPLGEFFLPSYDWLCSHLETKDPKSNNIKYPVWAWKRLNGQNGKKPDLRWNCWGNRGEKLVCMELEIDDNRVLCSDFELWHYPLNKWWLDPEVFTDEYDDERSEERDNWFKSLSKEEQEMEREKSWLQIFDVDNVYDSDWIRRGYDVQAIFWELRLEDVKKVQFFTAR